MTGAPIQLFGTARAEGRARARVEECGRSIFKNFNFTERHYLQFRAEFFNCDQHSDILPARGEQLRAYLHRAGGTRRVTPAIRISES